MKVGMFVYLFLFVVVLYCKLSALPASVRVICFGSWQETRLMPGHA